MRTPNRFSLMKQAFVSLNEKGIIWTIRVVILLGGRKLWTFSFTSYTPSPIPDVKSAPLNTKSTAELWREVCVGMGMRGAGRSVVVYGNQEV